MPAPELLLIKRMEDLHTALIGRCELGQFFITDTFPLATDSEGGPAENTRLYIYAVRYLFNSSGEFLQEDHVKVECLPDHRLECLRLKEEKERELLDGLGSYTFCDIAVRPFAVAIDGVKFGLIYSAEMDAINLEPGAIITFMEPWDGEYYT